MAFSDFKKRMRREAKADVQAVLDNYQSGRIVEEHIDGISFGLWTLIAIIILAATFAIALQTRIKWKPF